MTEITTNYIEEKILATEDFKTAERVAEELTYSISFSHKHGDIRARYDYLHQSDFESLGWTVVILGVTNANKEKLSNKLQALGYKICNWKENIAYNQELLEMFVLQEYSRDNEGSIITIQYANQLITLDQYKMILINKLTSLKTKQESLRKYLEDLIGKERSYYEDQLEEEAKERIINEALEKAKREGIIKR